MLKRNRKHKHSFNYTITAHDTVQIGDLVAIRFYNLSLTMPMQESVCDDCGYAESVIVSGGIIFR
jgi:hypothetical protein